jgi:uncharacterized surface protein with fasciclin (FAS1) repeats
MNVSPIAVKQRVATLMNTIRRDFVLRSAAMAMASASNCALSAEPTSIVDIVARKPELHTLYTLISETGLLQTLRVSGPFTMFAPTDDAFSRLPPATLGELRSNRELLKSVITFHVLPSRLKVAEVQNANLKTVQGSLLAVAKSGAFLTVEDAVVYQADLSATNGVVHVVDKVFFPPRAIVSAAR